MSQPKTAIGSRREVEVCAVAWMDLLGYGTMLRRANFDPTVDEAMEAVVRLNRFQDTIADHSSKVFPSVVMNDGAAIYRDLSPRSRAVTFDFVARAWELHQKVNQLEYSTNDPGARTVLAVGFRVRRGSNSREHLFSGIGKHILEEVEAGRKTVQQAVYHALTIRPTFDLVPELQANFAFAKAYLAETAGTKAGFAGNNFYADSELFLAEADNWMDASDPIQWSQSGISGTFLPIQRIAKCAAERVQYSGTRDAFEIAARIGRDEDVIERLRESTIRGGDPRGSA